MKAENSTRSLPDLIKEHAASTRMKLPVFPGAAFELQKLLAADETSVDQVVKVISKDQAMASHVLKLANSTFYSGMNRSIRTIKDAIMRLGLNHIFNLVICSSQQSYYKSSDKTLAKYMRILWQHALCVSIGSKWLMQELGYRILTEEAFLAGLLHDVGKLMVIKSIEAVYPKDEDLDDALISQTVASMHTEQGYRLMDEWSIPIVYCNVALKHHDEDFDTGDVLQMAVRASNHVCRKMGISTSSEKPGDLTAFPEVKALNIDVNVLSDLETVMAEAMQSEFGKLNDLALDQSTPYGIYL